MRRPAGLWCAVVLSIGAGPTLHVDPSADRHPIDPLIYGIASPDPRLAKEVALPLVRWGGDQTTRYNWQVDATNAGDDWFFMAGNGNPHPVPGRTVDKIVTDAKAFGGRAIVSVPVIDLIDRATATDCSFPVSIFGPQQKVNPYVHPTIDGKRTDAGNGRTPDGKPIVLTREQRLRIHTANSPAAQQAWVRHLVQRFGRAADGGVPLYELDNEPGGWNNTHRDVHPDATGHDELVSRSLAYAAAIKAVDPTAKVLGPGDFVMHYQSDGKPGDGSKEHGGLGQGDYYLRQFRRDADAHGGRRLLDYFDEHYYPFDQDGQTPDTIVECTRSLWDPTYVERNWYGKWHGAKAVIPNLRKWAAAGYPGTPVSVGEYGWGDVASPTAAVALADVLGIFGRERVALACLWTPPKPTDAMADAFRLYRNYDGHGGRYGDVGVLATSDDQGRVSVYAAERSADRALTLVAINKTGDELTSRVAVTGYRSATAYRFTFVGHGSTAVSAPAVSADGFDAALSGKSATVFVLTR